MSEKKETNLRIKDLSKKGEFVVQAIYENRVDFIKFEENKNLNCSKIINGRQSVTIINGNDKFCGMQLVENILKSKNSKQVKEYFIVIGNNVFDVTNKDTEESFKSVGEIDFQDTINRSMSEIIPNELIAMHNEEVQKAVLGEYDKNIQKKSIEHRKLCKMREYEINGGKELKNLCENYFRESMFDKKIRKVCEDKKQLEINQTYYKKVNLIRSNEKIVKQGLKRGKEQNKENIGMEK